MNNLNSKTILLVDDDDTNIFAAQQILAQNYKIASANSGENAFKYLDRRTPDLILLDINMPQMDGFEVIKQLKQNVRFQDIPVIFLTSEHTPQIESDCLTAGAVDFIRKPFVPVVLLSRVSKTLALREYQQNLQNLVEKQAEEICEHIEKINKMQQEVIVAMANLIENRDGSTGQHIKRTSLYVELILKACVKHKVMPEILTDEYCGLLIKAAPMHDIGKIRIPDAILQKPGRLTAEEFEIIKEHAASGGKIIDETMGNIEDKAYIEIAKAVATYHHEKWDGSGYPLGLKGEEIPLAARIMAVADVFDALTAKRCYKESFPLEKSYIIMEESKGTHFDPVILDAFLSSKLEIEDILG